MMFSHIISYFCFLYCASLKPLNIVKQDDDPEFTVTKKHDQHYNTSHPRRAKQGFGK